MTVVYILAPDRTPLMPCSAVIARLLLKEGKAKVVRRTPFTIKLDAQSERSYTYSGLHKDWARYSKKELTFLS